jgi:hypothetical protein
MAVNFISDSLVPRYDITMESMDQLFIGPVCGMGTVLLGDDESGSTSSACGVIGGVLFGGQTIAGVIGEVRAENDTVPSCDGSEL